MSREVNNIANEIDAIIARAMAEYSAAKGVDAFGDNYNSEPEPEPEHQEIPANSNSILVSSTTSRFSSAVWYENIQSKTVTLAGLGGIGSYVAFLLSRMHPSTLILYDDDVVESANMSGQLYGREEIGLTKVAATRRNIENLSEYYSATTFAEKFTRDSEATDIMICGFDSMEARKTFFSKWKERVLGLPESERGRCLFIDGRLAAESLQIFCIKGDDSFNMNKYEDKYLFSDYEADETICSYKQTSFMANMIASLMVNLFVNFCANEENPLIPRDLPFYTEYTAETMYFKVVA